MPACSCMALSGLGSRLQCVSFMAQCSARQLCFLCCAVLLLKHVIPSHIPSFMHLPSIFSSHNDYSVYFEHSSLLPWHGNRNRTVPSGEWATPGMPIGVFLDLPTQFWTWWLELFPGQTVVVQVTLEGHVPLPYWTYWDFRQALFFPAWLLFSCRTNLTLWAGMGELGDLPGCSVPVWPRHWLEQGIVIKQHFQAVLYLFC